MGRLKLAILAIEGLVSLATWLFNRKRCSVVEAPELLRIVDLGERMNGTNRLFGRRVKLKPARSADTAKFVGEVKNLNYPSDPPEPIERPYSYPFEIDLWKPAGSKVEVSGLFVDESGNVSSAAVLATVEFKDNMPPESPELEEVVDLGEQA